MIFDFNPVDILRNKVVAALQSETENETIIDITQRRNNAIARTKIEREKWKIRFDTHHHTPTKYEVNDLVVIENIAPSTGESRKLEPVYRGPYIVVKLLDRDRYVIADIPGMPRNQRPFSSVFTTDKMKRWCRAAPDLDSETENEEQCTETVQGQEGPNVRTTRTRAK